MSEKELRIALENAVVLSLSEGNEVARTYTELSENVENAVALYLRYVVYEDVGASDVLIDVEPDYFRMYVDKKLVFEEQASGMVSVIDGDMAIENNTLFFRHFAEGGLIFKLELDEGWSLSVEHIRHTIEAPPSLLEQALAEWKPPARE